MNSKTELMGILNVTPDSFSDGGELNTLEKIKSRAEQMVRDGATMLDIGGESSGPGSKDVSLEEELSRVIPALKVIIDLGVPISIDTYKAEVAEKALALGATIINDVTGLRGDPNMAATIAKHNAKVVIMYSKDPSARTTSNSLDYPDVMATIKAFLIQKIQYAEEQGIKRSNIILDPGMGAFISADPKYSFEILDRLRELESFKLPILVGTSRKSMHAVPMEERLAPSVASAMIAASNGAQILRVHDVKEHAQALNSLQCV